MNNQGFLYFARPIDFAKESSESAKRLNKWLDKVISSFLVYHPQRAWTVPAIRELGASPKLQSVNNDALEQSSAVLVLMDGSPSIGVPAELVLALQLGKPVVLVIDHGVWERSYFLSWLVHYYGKVSAVITYHHKEEDEVTTYRVQHIDSSLASSDALLAGYTPSSWDFVVFLRTVLKKSRELDAAQEEN